jgi:hypothetical protein
MPINRAWQACSLLCRYCFGLAGCWHPGPAVREDAFDQVADKGVGCLFIRDTAEHLEVGADHNDRCVQPVKPLRVFALGVGQSAWAEVGATTSESLPGGAHGWGQPVDRVRVSAQQDEAWRSDDFVKECRPSLRAHRGL